MDTQAHDEGVLLGPKWKQYGSLPDGKVEQGNIFTLELNVKAEHYGIVSLEEMTLVTTNGCEFLVPPQKNLLKLYKVCTNNRNSQNSKGRISQD